MSADDVLLIGQANWVTSLARGLAEADLDVATAPLQTARDALKLSTWRRVARSALIVRVGFRPGAPTWRGRAFDAALRLFRGRAVVCCYWIGTDVMHLLSEADRGVAVAGWRSVAAVPYHLAGSEPLQRELAEVGVSATLVGFPWRTVDPPDRLPGLPPTLTVLTYVPDARADFYGGPAVVEAARRMPGVQFLVMGGTGTWCAGPPPNVSFLGWVDDPAALYARSSCVVRMVDHDSIGGTAVEGLLFGRTVLYSQLLPHTTTIERTAESLTTALTALAAAHDSGRLVVDAEAAVWARHEFDHRTRFARLAGHLRQLATPT